MICCRAMLFGEIWQLFQRFLAVVRGLCHSWRGTTTVAVVSCVASRVLLFNRQVSDSLTRVLHSFVCELMVSLATSCLFVLFIHIPHRVHDTKNKSMLSHVMHSSHIAAGWDLVKLYAGACTRTGMHIYIYMFSLCIAITGWVSDASCWQTINCWQS